MLWAAPAASLLYAAFSQGADSHTPWGLQPLTELATAYGGSENETELLPGLHSWATRFRTSTAAGHCWMNSSQKELSSNSCAITRHALVGWVGEETKREPGCKTPQGQARNHTESKASCWPVRLGCSSERKHSGYLSREQTAHSTAFHISVFTLRYCYRTCPGQRPSPTSPPLPHPQHGSSTIGTRPLTWF